MYAFVNFRGVEEAVMATEALQDQQVAELTGGCNDVFVVWLGSV
jgi:hypothetical protein